MNKIWVKFYFSKLTNQAVGKDNNQMAAMRMSIAGYSIETVLKAPNSRLSKFKETADSKITLGNLKNPKIPQEFILKILVRKTLM
jgi:hypothetical protein